MRRFFLFTAFAIILIFSASSGLAQSTAELVNQGDQAMTTTNYRSAATIYIRALANAPDNPTIVDKMEQAVILKHCDSFLSLLNREVQKKGDIRISARQMVTLMSAREKVTMIDIRTPQERAFVIPPKAIYIQLPEIMRHLDRIPHEGTVVIICHSGPRAIIAATALRISGYDNVYALKGGIMSIADINAKKAPDNIR